MQRIRFLKKGVLVQKCDHLEIHLHEGGIIQRGENSFEWFHGDPIPFSPREMETTPYTEGNASTFDQAMRALVRAAMS